MKLKPVTVLLTGMGGPGKESIVKSLRGIRERHIRIIGTDMKAGAYGFAFVDKSYVVPPARSRAYLGALLAIVKRERVDVIIPSNTAELAKLSKNKALFLKHGARVSVSEPGALRIANNKHLLMTTCAKHGIPVPRFRRATNWREFREAVKELGYPRRAVCFKPPVSNGMRGFRILVKGRDRLHALLREKPSGIHADLEEIRGILESARPFPELLVMEYLPGEEYSVDLLARDGEALMVLPRLREEITMGISTVGTLIKDKEIIEYSRKLASVLRLDGIVGFQFKRDGRGTPKVIESNPRLQGTAVLSMAANANLVYIAIKLLLGETITIPKIRWGTRMVRHWTEIYFDQQGRPFRFNEQGRIS